MRMLNERQLKLEHVLHQLGITIAEANEYITVANGDTLNLHVVVALIQMCDGSLGYDIVCDNISAPDCGGLYEDIEVLQTDHMKPFVRWTPSCDLVDAITKIRTLFDWFYQDEGVHERKLMNDSDDWMCLLLTYQTLWADPNHGRSSRFRTRQAIGCDRHWEHWDNTNIFEQVESALRAIRLMP